MGAAIIAQAIDQALNRGTDKIAAAIDQGTVRIVAAIEGRPSAPASRNAELRAEAIAARDEMARAVEETLAGLDAFRTLAATGFDRSLLLNASTGIATFLDEIRPVEAKLVGIAS